MVIPAGLRRYGKQKFSYLREQLSVASASPCNTKRSFEPKRVLHLH